MMHKHVMTDADQEKAHALKNEILDLCLQRKVNTLVALAAARCAAECFESIINEQQGEVFTVDATTPPTTPSDAMRAAKDVVNEILNVPRFVRNPESTIIEIENKVAAIITRHLAVPGSVLSQIAALAHEGVNVTPAGAHALLAEIEKIARAATTSPETPVGGEAFYDQIVQAITDIEGARESHVQWANHLRLPHTFECQGCIDHAAHIGDADYHDEWIAKYNNVINVLFSINPFKRTTP